MENFDNLKVAIIHDQLTQYGGAEKTLENLLDIFPGADIYAGFCKPINISRKILNQKIYSGHVPYWLSFLMPLAFENFDLRKYEVIVSEGTAWPKGVITSPQQLHISNIYTPPRFLYGYSTEGQKRDKWYFKSALKIIDHFLRIWDYHAAQRPDYIVSISNEVAKRVQKFYGRSSTVIYPPVDIPSTTEAKTEGYYLCVSRLAAYKNIDKLIDAFNLSSFKLKIAGTGKEETRLKSLAGPNVEMLGFVTNEQKSQLLAGCKGFIFPTDMEDFGISVVEALSYGKPVLSHASGGPLEIIERDVTGMFFSDLSARAFQEKIKEFDANINAGKYISEKAKASVKKFSSERFKKEFGDFVKEKWEEKNA